MRSIILSATLVTGLAPIAWAQPTASIVGTVADTTGAVLPGATITATNLDTGFTRTLVSDEQGRYRAVNLPLGAYEVRAELEGFRAAVRRGVELHVGSEVTVGFKLEIGAVTEEVAVTAGAELVETTRAAMSGLVEQSQIEDLPLSGRSFTDLALLQPGVVWSSTAQSGFNRGFGLKVTIGGARPTQVNYTMDGSDINDNFNQVGSVSGRVLGVDAVREFRVVTNPFSAEYSRASGGEVQIATRSGTNDLHGALFAFHRNSAMDARDFFDVGDPPPFIMNQFGGSAGGPVLEGRTFFFAAYEGLRERLTTTRIDQVPDADVHRGFALDESGQLTHFGVDPRVEPYLARYPRPNGAVHGDGTGDFVWTGKQVTYENYVMARIDHQLSGAHSFYGRYVIDGGNRTSPVGFGLTEQRERNRTQYLSLGLDSTLGSRAVNALQISYSRSFLSGDNFAVDPLIGSLFNFSVDEIPPLVREIDPGGGVDLLGADASLPRTFAYNVFQIKNDLSWQLGRHGLKFGVNLQPIFDNFNSSFNRQPGDYAFGELRDFLRGSANTYTSTVPGSDTPRSVKNWIVAGYVQDDWQVHPHLTINAGLRYEMSTVPTEKHGRTARLPNVFDPDATIDDIVVGDPLFENPSLTNFAPRVGFAWDATGDGRTAVRGGVGVFYDLIQQILYRTAFNRTPPFQTWGTARTADVGAIDFPNAFETQSDLLAGSVAIDTIQFDMEQPTILQYGLGIQRELKAGMAVELRYSGSRGYDLMSGQDINQRVPEVLSDGRLFFGPDAPIFNPRMERIRVRISDVDSWYNALIVGFRQRYREGLQFQVSYTLGKAIITGSNLSGSSDFGNEDIGMIRQTPPGFLTREDNKGLAAFDVRHNLVINGTVDLPVHLSGVAGALLGGWSVQGVGRFMSGTPFMVIGSRASSERDVRRWGEVGPGPPDLIPGAEANSISPQNPDRYYDPTVFALPEPGVFGNLGRNTTIGPGIATVDLSLFKQLPSIAGGRFELRVEVFNLLNRPNFGHPSTELFNSTTGEISPTAGRITDTSSRAREIQLGLKLVF